MKALLKIKTAAAELNPDEQVELFRWWVESDTFKQRQFAALKRDIAIGIEQLKDVRYRTYDDNNLMQLGENVRRAGRARLKTASKKTGARCTCMG